MKAIRIILQDSDRIKLEFPFNRDLIEKIKQIDDAVWSRLLKVWHIPFTRPVFLQLLHRFPDLEYDRESFEPLMEQSLPLPEAKEANQRRGVVVVSAVEWNKERAFLLKPDPNPVLSDIVKQLPGANWSQQMNGWIIANSRDNLKLIFRVFKGMAWVDTSQVFNHLDDDVKLQAKDKRKTIPAKEALSLLSPENEVRITTFRDWLKSSRYSDSTVNTYSDGLKIFFRFCENRLPSEINNNDLIDFNNRYILKYGYSASFQNQVINAIKLYFCKIEDRKMDMESIQRPRREHKLPNVLSKQEIEILLKAAAHNIKHQAALSLIYSCGLRRGELLNLKLTDVDSKRGLLIIRNAKGKKDRVSPLSEKVVDILRKYYLKHKPITYLFEGWKVGWKYSSRSLEEVLKKCLTLAGIKKPVALHWLRHSYATHLLENGTDLRYIQEILGHKSSKTTEIYTHVSTKQIGKIKSPFDDLDL